MNIQMVNWQFKLIEMDHTTGGSLSVQIYGSSPSDEDLSSKGSNKSIDILSIADKKNRNNSLSASPIVVRSSEDIKRIAK